MKGKVIGGILIFSLILNVAVIGTYLLKRFDKPDSFFASGKWGGKGHFLKDMDIDKREQEKIIELFREFRASSVETHKQIHDLEDELYTIIKKDSTDWHKADQIMDEIGEKRLNLSKYALRHFLKLKTFLTPEQQENFYNKIMKNRPDSRFRKGRNKYFRERRKRHENRWQGQQENRQN